MQNKDPLDNILTSKDENKKSDLDVLKELFTIKNIETKSELTINQIILFNQKRMIAKMLDWGSLDDCLNDFMLLMVSKNRRGRGEFVDGFKSERERETQAQTGFFSGIKNRLGMG